VNSVSRVLLIAGLLAGVTPARAMAEWQFAPFVGFTFAGDTNIALLEDGPRDRHWLVGGSARLLGAGPVGLESLLLYSPGFFEPRDTEPVFADEAPTTLAESRTFALMGNVVLTTPRAWNEYGLRPYVSGGMGLLYVYGRDQLLPARGNLLGYNAGGGAVGFLSDRVGLRFDLRYISTTPHGRESFGELLTVDAQRVRLHYWTATVGVVFKY
jgi:hypothetical protein